MADAAVQHRPFGATLRDLLIQKGMTTAMGNPNWAAFAHELPTTQYESLRKAVTGERRPSPKIMEEAAEVLEVDPSEEFYEYQLWQVQRSFDPAEVGEEEAFANLQAWLKAQKKR